MQTYRVVGAPHYVSHWDSNGFEISVKFEVGALVNSERDLLAIYRNAFESAPFDPAILNIDTLHNPPSPPKGIICCGGGGSIDFNSLNIPEQYFFVDDIARDDYFSSQEHESELKADVLIVSAGHLQKYDGTQWVYLAFTVKGENATIAIGDTVTGESGTDAQVVNEGTETNAVLKFTIPRGERGEAGSGDVETITVEAVAAEDISGHHLVSRVSSGGVITASWDNPDVLGLTMQSVFTGGVVRVIVSGVVKHSGWSFISLTSPIVLNKFGQPVQADTTNYPVLTRVGRPISLDSFLVSVEAPIK
jgi:hypothetical protein